MSRLPFELSIPEPCRQSWHEMSGTASERHCASCKKTVHNLATLTPRRIEHLIHSSNGHLCARVTRREDGSLVTADKAKKTASLRSAFVLASALTSSPAIAQDAVRPQAIVRGNFVPSLNQNWTAPGASREVLFIQNDKAILTISTDAAGKFTATLPPGTYDVVFRRGIMFGERIKRVDFHSGLQEFGVIQGEFNYGHLAEVDRPEQDFATTGVLVSIPAYRINPRNMLLHPIATYREIAWQARRLIHHLSS
jgi:hypothetical protein